MAKVLNNNGLHISFSRSTAEEIVGVIREVMMEPTEEMEYAAAIYAEETVCIWKDMLAASPLGESEQK